MAGTVKDKKGAIFIDTEDGKEKLLGYRVMLDGVLGIAYMKNSKVEGFKPMSEFIDEFYGGVFLTLNSAGMAVPNESCNSAREHINK